MAARVGAGLPAAVGELPDLVPGHAAKLVLVRRAVPHLDSLPAQTLALPHESGWDEFLCGKAKPVQDWLGHFEYRGEAVIEGHGQRLGRRRVEDRVGERDASPAGADELGQLVLERVRRYGEGRVPGGADGVVAEHENVAHRGYTSAPSCS